MKDAKSLLDGLLGGGGLGGLASGAKGAWDGQSGLAKGAMAGGLLGILLGGSGTRKMAKSALKVGGAALIGGLAYKAYEDWQGRNSASHRSRRLACPRRHGFPACGPDCGG